MTLDQVKKSFKTKIKVSSGLKEPSNIDLSELFKEALHFVSKRCIPTVLKKNIEIDGEVNVLRYISDGNYIQKPVVPIFDTKDANYSDTAELNIDETLSYAVINKAAALYSRDNSDITKFNNECLSELNRYKANYNKAN